MTGIPFDEKPLHIKGLLGLVLDGRPEELHVTRGANFFIYGGSKSTHQQMVECTLRFNDEVDKRGKALEEINARELHEISEQVWQDD